MQLDEVNLDLKKDAAKGLGETTAAERKFMRLRDEWKTKRGHEPSTLKVVMMPAYQQIIGMGPEAIPFLLRELDTDLDNWFWALMSITGENPVQEASRGNGKSMAQAWLEWGKERGYEW